MRRGWGYDEIFLIVMRGRVTELNRIASFHVEGQAALRTVQLPRAAECDLFKIVGFPAFQGRFEGLISRQVDLARAVLLQSFCVGGGLVGVTRLVAVGSVRWNGNSCLVGRGANT